MQRKGTKPHYQKLHAQPFQMIGKCRFQLHLRAMTKSRPGRTDCLWPVTPTPSKFNLPRRPFQYFTWKEKVSFLSLAYCQDKQWADLWSSKCLNIKSARQMAFLPDLDDVSKRVKVYTTYYTCNLLLNLRATQKMAVM